MGKALRKISVLALGLLLAVVALELFLGAFASLHRRAGVAREGGFRILVIGNSYTKGDGAGAGEAYGDFLERTLKEKHPGLRAQVFNGGVSLGTTSLLLERLPAQLEEIKPDILALMVGDPNFVFNYGFERWLEKRRPSGILGKLRLGLLDLLYSSRTFRWVGFVRGGFAEYSSAGWNAKQWLALVEDVSYNPRWLDPTRSKAAYKAIEAYYNSGEGRSKEVAVALLQLASLMRKPAAWDHWLAEIRAMAPGEFLYLPYSQMQRKIRTGLFHGEELAQLEAQLAKLKLNYPGDKTYAEVERSQLFAHSQTKPYLPARLKAAQRCEYIEKLLAYNALNVRHYATLAHCYLGLGREQEAAGVMMRATEKNPYSQHGPLEFLYTIQYQTKSEAVKKSIQDFLDRFFRENPGFHFLSYTRTSPEKRDWVRSDVREMIALARARGIPVVIQSYPPMRNGFVRVIDRLVPDLAKENSVPLSDTNSRLRELYTSVEEKESYYSNEFGAEDHHLNAKGNAVVAETLYRTLESEGLLPATK